MMETTIMKSIPRRRSRVLGINHDSTAHRSSGSSIMQQYQSVGPLCTQKTMNGQVGRKDPSRNTADRSNSKTDKRLNAWPRPRSTKKMMLSKSQTTPSPSPTATTTTTTTTTTRQKHQELHQTRQPPETRQPSISPSFQLQADARHNNNYQQQRHSNNVQQRPSRNIESQRSHSSAITSTTTKKQRQQQQMRDQRRMDTTKQKQDQQTQQQKQPQQHRFVSTERSSPSMLLHERRKSGLQTPKASIRPGLIMVLPRIYNTGVRVPPEFSSATTKSTKKSLARESESKQLRHRLDSHRDRDRIARLKASRKDEGQVEQKEENKEEQQPTKSDTSLNTQDFGKFMSEISSIKSLREKRDAKLKKFLSSMAQAKAQNGNGDNDGVAVTTSAASVHSLGDRSGIENDNNANINNLVSTLTLLKQQNLAKAANLVQRLEQRVFAEQQQQHIDKDSSNLLEFE